MSDTKSQPLPSTCRGLICPGPGKPLTVQSIPTPEAVPGSVVIRILAASIDSPFIPGARAIGRVAALGPDATSLQPGQLVMLEHFVRGRNDPDVQILWDISHLPSPASKKLMEDSWRNGSFADPARQPRGGRSRLFRRRPHLTYISKQLVAYGGLRGIDLKAGATVIVAPATGGFSSAAVEVAYAIGARVIVVGRNLDALQKIAASNERVTVVQLKGNVDEDTAALQKFGTIDAYIDISPAAAFNPTHVRSCFMALKRYGRASLMGVIHSDIAVPYEAAVFKNLTIRGQFMYEREDARGIIKLAEAGVLKLGKSAGQEVVGQFPLEEWEKVMDAAKNNPEAGKMVLFTP